MAKIIADRVTAVREGGIVVFLIGMRVNRWWKLHRWLPVARAMPPMLEELAKDPASGLLGGTLALTRQGPMLVQYWESVEKLQTYASSRAAKHLPAWADFNRRVGTNGDATFQTVVVRDVEFLGLKNHAEYEHHPDAAVREVESEVAPELSGTLVKRGVSNAVVISESEAAQRRVAEVDARFEAFLEKRKAAEKAEIHRRRDL